MAEVPILSSPLLDAVAGIRHAFFTRQGGVSAGLYDSLNVGVGSRDDPAAVTRNRALAAQRLGRPAQALVTNYQVHSALAVVAEGDARDRGREADALVTARPGLVCGALAADCAPVLIAEPAAGLVAAVHAGWKGALSGVTEAAVEKMVELGGDPALMVAAVGPCIGPASYEVGLEFLERFETADADYALFFAAGARAGKRLFDLPGFVLSRLAAVGVAQAEWTGHDTLADEARFFSNRRAVLRGEPDFGRLLSAIVLEG